MDNVTTAASTQTKIQPADTEDTLHAHPMVRDTRSDAKQRTTSSCALTSQQNANVLNALPNHSRGNQPSSNDDYESHARADSFKRVKKLHFSRPEDPYLPPIHFSFKSNLKDFFGIFERKFLQSNKYQPE